VLEPPSSDELCEVKPGAGDVAQSPVYRGAREPDGTAVRIDGDRRFEIGKRFFVATQFPMGQSAAGQGEGKSRRAWK
jgi:hypothetical protein